MTTDPRKDSNWRWWRAEAIIRDNYECQGCGVKGGRKGNEQLHAHHIIPVKDGGENELDNLITLCTDCHNNVHSGSLENIPIDTTCPICGDEFEYWMHTQRHAQFEHGEEIPKTRIWHRGRPLTLPD